MSITGEPRRPPISGSDDRYTAQAIHAAIGVLRAIYQSLFTGRIGARDLNARCRCVIHYGRIYYLPSICGAMMLALWAISASWAPIRQRDLSVQGRRAKRLLLYLYTSRANQQHWETKSKDDGRED